MKISGIPSYNQYSQIKKINKENKENKDTNSSVTFEGNGKKRALAGTAAILATIPMVSSCTANNPANIPADSSVVSEQSETQSPDSLAERADALANSGALDKTILADISLISVPISELYFTNSDG